MVLWHLEDEFADVITGLELSETALHIEGFEDLDGLDGGDEPLFVQSEGSPTKTGVDTALAVRQSQYEVCRRPREWRGDILRGYVLLMLTQIR